MSTKYRASVFVPAVLRRVGEGYVYGATGQTCTTSLLAAKERQYGPNGTSPAMEPGYYCKVISGVKDYTKGLCAKWLGKKISSLSPFAEAKRVQDCSNFFQDVRRELGEKTGSHNAQGLYNDCQVRGPIAEMPHKPGVGLFKWNPDRRCMSHVGMYIGNGRCVESAGVSTGVVQHAVPKSFTHYGLYKWMEYDVPADGTTLPDPNPEPDTDNDGPKAPATYAVVKGDSLSRIAAKYGLKWPNIAALNNIKAPWIIHVGQVLRLVPAAVYYTVVRGDTLSGIGKKLGKNWRNIAKDNAIDAPYVIFAGQKLLIK